MKYSVLRGVSGRHDNDSIVKRLMEHTTFQEEYLPQKKTMQTNKVVCCLQQVQQTKRDCILLPCMSVGVSKPTIQEKVTDVL